MKTPANGPISEYGPYSTANAAAALAGFGYVVALKNTYVPTPAVKMPSPSCEISLVENSRRNARSAHRIRRSRTKEARRGMPLGADATCWRSAPSGPSWADTQSAYCRPGWPGYVGRQSPEMILVSQGGSRAWTRRRPPPWWRGPPEAAPGVLLPLQLAADELGDRVAGLVVAVLDRRRLHEVRGRGQDRAPDAAVLGDLRSADRVDDDAG